MPYSCQYTLPVFDHPDGRCDTLNTESGCDHYTFEPCGQPAIAYIQHSDGRKLHLCANCYDFLTSCETGNHDELVDNYVLKQRLSN
jgi:hypothetical protein